MHIRIIIPTTAADHVEPDWYDDLGRPGTRLTHVNIERGPRSIESELDEALAVASMLEQVAVAATEDVDAIVIDCMGDPGLAAARELVSLPVVGPAQASMHLAASLAHSFTILTVLDTLGPMFDQLAHRSGLAGKLRSTRSVQIPVLELRNEPEHLMQALIEQSLLAIEQDDAHAIIFGCTGMKGYATRLARELELRGHPRIPVIDPIRAAIALAETLVALGLTHSGQTYPTPPAKEYAGYELSFNPG